MANTKLKQQPSDAAFTRDPGQSFTLPSRFYIDSEIYELEKDAIFYRTWHYAGHASQVAEKTATSQRKFITKIEPPRVCRRVVCSKVKQLSHSD